MAGQLVDRTEYAALFDVMGYVYGGRPAEGKFRIPNLMDINMDAAHDPDVLAVVVPAVKHACQAGEPAFCLPVGSFQSILVPDKKIAELPARAVKWDDL